jgi:hypothetical protein
MRIIVGSDIAHYCQRIGAFDNRMAYIIGLQQLGHDVHVMAEINSKRCHDSNYNPVPFEQWPGRRQFEGLAKQYGIWPRCCVLYNHGQATHGISLTDAIEVAKSADLLLNISGKLKTPEILEAVKYRLFIDLAPAKTQVYRAEYGIDQGFDQHQYFFTVGLNIGTAACNIPTCDLNWHPIMHPVVLDLWPARVSDQPKRFTTITNWAGKETFKMEGRFSGEKSDNWLKFIDLPKRTQQELEIALKINPGYENDGTFFEENGWLLSDPMQLRTLEDYRNYIGNSRAEISIANNRYVQFKTGWFSDRTVRYLASGKPALIQSTGIEDRLPTGKGLLTFTTIDEAVAGIEAINSDYTAHCRASRAIAEEYFDSAKVLSQMLQRIGF